MKRSNLKAEASPHKDAQFPPNDHLGLEQIQGTNVHKNIAAIRTNFPEILSGEVNLWGEAMKGCELRYHFGLLCKYLENLKSP